MSKKFFYVSLIITVMLLGATVVLAQEDFGLTETGQSAGYETGESNTVVNVTKTAVDIVLQLLAVAFFVVIVYAGLRWMTARGNNEYVGRAQHALQAGIIGIIITVSAYGISSFVFSRLAGGATGTEDCGSIGGHCVDVEVGCTAVEKQFGGANACPVGNSNITQVCCAAISQNVKTINCCAKHYFSGSSSNKVQCESNVEPSTCVSTKDFNALFYDNTICSNLSVCNP